MILSEASENITISYPLHIDSIERSIHPHSEYAIQLTRDGPTTPMLHQLMPTTFGEVLPPIHNSCYITQCPQHCYVSIHLLAMSSDAHNASISPSTLTNPWHLNPPQQSLHTSIHPNSAVTLAFTPSCIIWHQWHSYAAITRDITATRHWKNERCRQILQKIYGMWISQEIQIL